MIRNYPDVYESVGTFRKFMVSVNFRGGGVLFEALSDQEIDAKLLKCRDDTLRSIYRLSSAFWILTPVGYKILRLWFSKKII